MVGNPEQLMNDLLSPSGGDTFLDFISRWDEVDDDADFIDVRILLGD